jgi:hypothetical protein
MLILKSFPTEWAREQEVKGAGGGSGIIMHCRYELLL